MELDSGQYPKVASFFEKLLTNQMFVYKGSNAAAGLQENTPMMQSQFTLKKLHISSEQVEQPGFIAVLFMSGQFWRQSQEAETRDFATCFNQYVSQHLVATNDVDLDPSSEQHIRLGDVCMIPQ